MHEPPVILEALAPPPTAAVIWLHGLGADGHDFAPIVPQLGAVRSWTRFVFPHAPVRPVSINFGMRMRAWYDIREEGGAFVSDENHLRESQRAVEGWIEGQREAGIPANRIVLAGFSQGGAITLHPDFSPTFVARAPRCRGSGPHGPKDTEGVAYPTSKWLSGVRPASASRLAAAAGSW